MASRMQPQQEVASSKRPPPPRNGASGRAALRGNILDSTIKSQAALKSGQDELQRQGSLLHKSLRDGRKVSSQASSTRQHVESLIEETKLSNQERLFRCCCPCLYATCCRRSQKNSGGRKSGIGNQRGSSRSSLSHSSEEEDELHACLDRLRHLLDEANKRRPHEASWRRTLGPSLYDRKRQRGSSADSPQRQSPKGKDVASQRRLEEAELWHRQMDASLVQLQLAAEEMETTLEQQTRLANLLAIYLNHGAEQVLEANKRLVAERKRF